LDEIFQRIYRAWMTCSYRPTQQQKPDIPALRCVEMHPQVVNTHGRGQSGVSNWQGIARGNDQSEATIQLTSFPLSKSADSKANSGEVYPQLLVRWVIAHKFVAIEVANEVLRRGTLSGAAIANTHYKDPFLPALGISEREEVGALPIRNMRRARRS